MNIDHVTLAAYLIMLLVVGALFARFNRNLGDFVRGGARAAWWMVGTSMTMAGISAFTFTGNGSAAYEVGPSVFVIYAANVLGLLLATLYLARRYRQTRALTAADAVRARFGDAAEQFGVVLGVLLNPLYSAVQLWALAVFVGTVYGFPVFGTIVVLGLVVLVYSITGGAWAVMATDVIQGVVLFGVTLLVAVLALVAVGGPAGFIAHFSELRAAGDYAWFKGPGAYPNSDYTWQWALAAFVMQLVGQIHLGSAGRYLAAKDGREATRAAALACGLMALGTLAWFIPPMVARFLYADEVAALTIKDPATAAYAVAAGNLLPAGLMGTMIAAMFSATMSSLDTGLVGTTSTIVNNFLPRVRARLGLAVMPEEKGLRLCRLVTFGLGLYIIALALVLSTQDRVRLFDLMLNLGTVVGGPLGLPLLAGIVLRRLTPGAYFIVFVGGLVPSVWSLLSPHLGFTAWNFAERAGWILFGAAVATTWCALRARRASADHRTREVDFFRLMEKPVDFEREVGGALDGPQAVITGRVLLVMGGLMLLYLLVPNSGFGRLGVAALAGFVASCGLGLLLLGTRASAAPPPGTPTVPGSTGADLPTLPDDRKIN